ncbi:phosphotransferase, partial [Acinetobacter baumannii]
DVLDERRLRSWLAENVGGFEGPLRILKFTGGQSNPTYRVDTGNSSYVLRRKPFGALLPSAHAVDREYRVLSGLHRLGYPVP